MNTRTWKVCSCVPTVARVREDLPVSVCVLWRIASFISQNGLNTATRCASSRWCSTVLLKHRAPLMALEKRRCKRRYKNGIFSVGTSSTESLTNLTFNVWNVLYKDNYLFSFISSRPMEDLTQDLTLKLHE